MSKHNKLTAGQRVFGKEYIIDFNASAAALRSGFKHPDYGRQLLTKPHVQDYIQKLMEEREKTATKNGNDVIEELIKIGFSDLTQYAEVTTKLIKTGTKKNLDGKPEDTYEHIQFVRLKDTEEWTETAALQELTANKDGSLKIKLHDKRAALTDLGKHFAVIPERHIHTGEDGKPIQTESTTKVIIGLPGKMPLSDPPDNSKTKKKE